ncbi:MAG: hypothetical protein LDL41_03440 [Coleofasciculus sp. S288]|nr:hypothetical protein [Coleofasciculus sp. S288]
MQLGPGFWATFCYYFTGLTLIGAILASKALGLSLATGMPYRLGMVFGLLGGLVGAYFNRTATLSLEFQNEKTFTTTLNNALAEMGFEQKSELDDFIVYQRPAFSHLFSGSVFVQIEKGVATIVSRSTNIKRLHKKIQ